MTNLFDLVDSGLVAEQKGRAKDGYMKKNHYVRDFTLIDDDGIHGRCLRQNFYEWFAFSKTNMQAKSLYMFKSGFMLEDLIGNMLKQYHADTWSVEMGRVVMIQPEGLTHPIKGKIDFVLRSQDKAPWTIIVELKTSHGRGISNRKFGRRYTGPLFEHLMQGSFYYQHCDTTPELYLGIVREEIIEIEKEREETEDIETGNKYKINRLIHLENELNRPERVNPDELIIAYLSREDFNRLQFSTCGDLETSRGKAPSLIEALPMNDFRCFKAMDKYIEEKHLPPKTYKDGPEKFPCSYCDWRDQCSKDDNL